MATTKTFSEPKPFLKWVGGKTQLISSIESSLYQDIIYSEFNISIKGARRNINAGSEKRGALGVPLFGGAFVPIFCTFFTKGFTPQSLTQN